MFIGHFGVGLGAKSIAPRVSLGTLFLSAQFVDLIWPTLLLLGLEKVEIRPGITLVTPLDFVSYPISHSLLTVIGWGVLVGLVYHFARRYAMGGIVLGGLVVSHWVLDFLTHRPDLPLAPGAATKVGLGLWNSLPATVAVEGAIFALGVWLYLRSTRALDRKGVVGFWSMIVFLLVTYVSNLFGPPPPNAMAIAWTAQAMWLLVIWGYWVDRHRVAVSPD